MSNTNNTSFRVAPAARPDGVTVYRLVTEPQGACTEAGIDLHYATAEQALEAGSAQGWGDRTKRFAAIGTDGTRPVVWGLGAYEDTAMADAWENEGDSPGIDDMVVVEITAVQDASVRAGVVDISELGIELTRSQIRALAGS